MYSMYTCDVINAIGEDSNSIKTGQLSSNICQLQRTRLLRKQTEELVKADCSFCCGERFPHCSPVVSETFYWAFLTGIPHAKPQINVGESEWSNLVRFGHASQRLRSHRKFACFVSVSLRGLSVTVRHRTGGHCLVLRCWGQQVTGAAQGQRCQRSDTVGHFQGLWGALWQGIAWTAWSAFLWWTGFGWSCQVVFWCFWMFLMFVATRCCSAFSFAEEARNSRAIMKDRHVLKEF